MVKIPTCAQVGFSPGAHDSARGYPTIAGKRRKYGNFLRFALARGRGFVADRQTISFQRGGGCDKQISVVFPELSDDF